MSLSRSISNSSTFTEGTPRPNSWCLPGILKRWTEVHSTHDEYFCWSTYAQPRPKVEVGYRPIFNNGALKATHLRYSFVQGWETKGQITIIAATRTNDEIITWLTQSKEEPPADDRWCITEKVLLPCGMWTSFTQGPKISACTDLTWSLYLFHIFQIQRVGLVNTNREEIINIQKWK